MPNPILFIGITTKIHNLLPSSVNKLYLTPNVHKTADALKLLLTTPIHYIVFNPTSHLVATGYYRAVIFNITTPSKLGSISHLRSPLISTDEYDIYFSARGNNENSNTLKAILIKVNK